MENISTSEPLKNNEELNKEVDFSTEKRLWNPKGFLFLSIFFSFLPAAILYAVNYGRLGFSKKKNISLAVSFIVFVSMLIIAYMVDQGIIKSIFYGLNIGAAVFMNNDQSKLFKSHIENGGRKALYIIPVIISTVITAIIIIVMILYTSNVPNQKLVFKGSELYYTKSIQKGEAKKLGDYLNQQGLFSNNNKIAVKIDKQSAVYKFSLIIDKSRLEDKSLERYAKEMSHELSANVFNNNKVEIEFCDNVFKPLKTISE